MARAGGTFMLDAAARNEVVLNGAGGFIVLSRFFTSVTTPSWPMWSKAACAVAWSVKRSVLCLAVNRSPSCSSVTLTRFISLAANRLWQKFLSAGRVQSPTLALMVDREAEIKAFVSEDFWQVRVTLEHEGDRFTARHKTERFTDQAAAQAAFDHIGQDLSLIHISEPTRLGMISYAV